MTTISIRARRPRRVLRLPALLVGSALALGACSGPTAETTAADESLGTLSMNFNWLKTAEFSGEYMAEANGHWADAGFESVELISGGPSGTSSESMVLSGSALLGTTNILGTAQMVDAEEAPLKIIGTRFQQNPFAVISLADDPVDTPEELVGRTIGNRTGTNETVFSAFLEVNGIDPEDVEIVTIQSDLSPLVNGDVDAVVGYSTNDALTLELQGNDTVVLRMSEHGLPFSAGSVVTSEEHIAENREALKAALEGQIRGWRDAVADPQAAADLTVEEYGADLGLDPEKELRQARLNVDLVVTPETEQNGLLTMSEELIQDNLQVLEVAGYDVTAEELFDMTLLEEVYEENPDLLELRPAA